MDMAYTENHGTESETSTDRPMTPPPEYTASGYTANDENVFMIVLYICVVFICCFVDVIVSLTFIYSDIPEGVFLFFIVVFTVIYVISYIMLFRITFASNYTMTTLLTIQTALLLTLLFIYVGTVNFNNNKFASGYVCVCLGLFYIIFSMVFSILIKIKSKLKILQSTPN